MRATLQQYKDLIESAVWLDIRKDLLLRRSTIRDKLEVGDPDRTLSRDLLALAEERERGRSDEIRFIVDYPQYVVDNFEALSKEDKNE